MTRVYLDPLCNHSGILRFFALCLLKHHFHYTFQSTKVNFLENPGKDSPESVTRRLNLGQEFSSLSFCFCRGQDFLELIFPQIMEVFDSISTEMWPVPLPYSFSFLPLYSIHLFFLLIKSFHKI